MIFGWLRRKDKARRQAAKGGFDYFLETFQTEDGQGLVVHRTSDGQRLTWGGLPYTPASLQVVSYKPEGRPKSGPLLDRPGRNIRPPQWDSFTPPFT